MIITESCCTDTPRETSSQVDRVQNTQLTEMSRLMSRFVLLTDIRYFFTWVTNLNKYTHSVHLTIQPRLLQLNESGIYLEMNFNDARHERNPNLSICAHCTLNSRIQWNKTTTTSNIYFYLVKYLILIRI